MIVPTATGSGLILTTTQARLRYGVQRPFRHRHRAGDCVRVHGHEVIIAGTRAEVTPRHNFVIRVANGTQTVGLTPCRRREKKPSRYDHARAGQAAEAEMRAEGTGGQRGDDQ